MAIATITPLESKCRRTPRRFDSLGTCEHHRQRSQQRIHMGNNANNSIQLTQMLQSGKAAAELLPLVYEELREIASQRMRGENAGHTLQATALVNEAYLRLAGTTEMTWRDRRHFYAAAAEAMRRVLVDHARKTGAQKRGAAFKQVSLYLNDEQVEVEVNSDQLLALDAALSKLELEDPRAAEVTRLRFFGGLSMFQIAEALELSERSVHREWTFARTRLHELVQAE